MYRGDNMSNDDKKVTTILQQLANDYEIKKVLDNFGLRMFFANNGLHITKNSKDYTKLADSYNRCTAVGLWPGTVDSVSAMTNEYGVLIHVTKISGEYTYSSIVYADRINKTEKTIENPLNDLSLIERVKRRIKKLKR